MLRKRPRDSADMAGVPAVASVGLLPALLGGGATGFVSGLTVVGGGVFLAGGHGLTASTPLYAAADLAGAILGTAVGLRWMTEQATRLVLALLLALAGLRLPLR